jgi:hypothetical protein
MFTGLRKLGHEPVVDNEQARINPRCCTNGRLSFC